jgi:hypothetical protein
VEYLQGSILESHSPQTSDLSHFKTKENQVYCNAFS